MASALETEIRYKTLLQNLPKEYKDKYKELYGEMKTEKLKDIDRDYYFFNDSVSLYFKNIFQEIKKGNPTLPLNNLEFFVSRNYSPNALTSLDGTIAFNLSLVANCQNESQIAFVICHELAHYKFKHPELSVKKMFDLLYSKQSQKQMKEIARSEFDAYDKAEKYLKNAVYNNRKHGREYEEQADSLALQLLLNTRYDAKEAVQSLLMLDKIDSLTYESNVELDKFFDSPQYKFKKSWLDEEETMFKKGKRVFDNKADEDSVKTHPSCKKRAVLLEGYLKNVGAKSGAKNLQSPEMFKNLAEKAEFETLISAYDFNNVDYCLFQTLKSLQNRPDNVFLKALIAQCLNDIYDAQKEHTLAKIVSIPKGDQSTKYATFLRFLNNMSLSEIAAVNFYYLNKQGKSYLTDEFYLFNFVIAAKNAAKTKEFDTLKALYLSSFTKGKYRDIIVKY